MPVLIATPLLPGLLPTLLAGRIARPSTWNGACGAGVAQGDRTQQDLGTWGPIWADQDRSWAARSVGPGTRCLIWVSWGQTWALSLCTPLTHGTTELRARALVWHPPTHRTWYTPETVSLRSACTHTVDGCHYIYVHRNQSSWQWWHLLLDQLNFGKK